MRTGSSIGLHGIKPSEAFFQHLRQAVAQGTPFRWAKFVDDIPALASVKRDSPTTKTIGRLTMPDEGLQFIELIDPSDLSALTERAAQLMAPITRWLQLNPTAEEYLDVMEIANESDPPAGPFDDGPYALAGYHNLGAIMRICLQMGQQQAPWLGWGIGSFNNGTPEYPEMQAFASSGVFSVAKAMGNVILCVHEGVFGTDAINKGYGKPLPDAPAPPPFSGQLVGRCVYWEQIAGANMIPIVVTETYYGGNKDNLADQVQRADFMDRWAANLWYLEAVLPYTHAPGAGWGSSDMTKVYPALLEHMLAIKDLPHAEPGPPPPSNDCRGKPREQYGRTYVLLPPGTDQSWADAVIRATWDKSRYTLGGSADDAGIGDLDRRHVKAINPHLWPSDLGAFFNSYYPGVTMETLTAGSPQELYQLLAGDEPGYLEVQPISQRDPRWANVAMGGDKTIGNWGCLLTAYNMWTNYAGITAYTPPDALAAYRAAGAMNAQYMLPGAMKTAYPERVTYNGYIGSSNPTQQRQAILTMLEAGVPAVIRVDFDPTTAQWEQHWVLAVGAIEGGQDWLIADPWHGDFVPLSERYGTKVIEVLLYGWKEPSQNSYTGPDVGSFVAGVDQPASDWYWSTAKAVFDVTGLAPKFHTTGDSSRWFGTYRNPHFNLVRIVLNPGFSVTGRDPELVASAIFSEIKEHPRQFYNLGARDFVLLNEPNIENMGKLWDNADQFGATFKLLCQFVKQEYPGMRVWYPGMSPGGTGSTPPADKPQHAFIEAARRQGAFDGIYGIVEHVYTGITSNAATAADQMLLEVMDFRQRWAMTRPLVIGEFSVNEKATGGYKASVYRRFFADLDGVPGIQAAYSFTSSWHPNADSKQEGWLENGIHTAFGSV